MSGFLALLRVTWQTWLAQRSFFFLLAFGWMIPPLIYLFVWSTAAREQPIGGLTRGEFVAYYLILIVVNQLTYAQTNWTVGDQIREGGLSGLLLRPMSPIFDTIATELAGKAVYLLFIVPVTFVLALMLRSTLDLTLTNALAFGVALPLAWMLRFLWGYAIALLAFWASRADSLLALQDTLLFLLAGQVAPLALLPGWLATIAVWLPFRYMLGFPVELLTGQLTSDEMFFGFVLQVGWLSVAAGLSWLGWQRGLRHYSAIGG
ncbi:MAG: ABC-2 family transporter protein [Chloroflexota bacterium]